MGMEIISVILTLINVILGIKRSMWFWISGIIACLCYSYVFNESHLYGQVMLQFVFCIQSVIGWYQWKLNKGIDGIKPRRLNNTSEYILMVGMFLWIMSTQYVNLDYLLVISSLFATYLMGKRYVESWSIWILTDIFYIHLFHNTQLYYSMGLYMILLILACVGLGEWDRKSKELK
jgi:nicotinamide mononucleotide transporter